MKRQVEIEECEIDGDEAVVTWFWVGPDELDTAPKTVTLELEWQPEESDVGVGAGYIVHGDAPREVCDKVAEMAADKLADEYDDRY